jgi:AcrR family transcriptional regulator
VPVPVGGEASVSPDAPTAASPRRGRPGYDQETVLRRAIELFNEQGYDGTSMGDLARELGFSKSAIYHHVPSKTHLLSQALDEALDGLTEVLDEASREVAGATAYDRLRRAVRLSVAVLVDHQPAVTLLLRVRGNSDVEVAALRRRRDLDARFAALVREAVDEGSLRSDVPPALVSRLLFGMVNSLVEWHRPGGAVDAEQLSDAITTIAFDGLALGRLDPRSPQTRDRSAHQS